MGKNKGRKKTIERELTPMALAERCRREFAKTTNGTMRSLFTAGKSYAGTWVAPDRGFKGIAFCESVGDGKVSLYGVFSYLNGRKMDLGSVWTYFGPVDDISRKGGIYCFSGNHFHVYSRGEQTFSPVFRKLRGVRVVGKDKR